MYVRVSITGSLHNSVLSLQVRCDYMPSLVRRGGCRTASIFCGRCCCGASNSERNILPRRPMPTAPIPTGGIGLVCCNMATQSKFPAPPALLSLFLAFCFRRSFTFARVWSISPGLCWMAHHVGKKRGQHPRGDEQAASRRARGMWQCWRGVGHGSGGGSRFVGNDFLKRVTVLVAS